MPSLPPDAGKPPAKLIIVRACITLSCPTQEYLTALDHFANGLHRRLSGRFGGYAESTCTDGAVIIEAQVPSLEGIRETFRELSATLTNREVGHSITITEGLFAQPTTTPRLWVPPRQLQRPSR